MYSPNTEKSKLIDESNIQNGIYCWLYLDFELITELPSSIYLLLNEVLNQIKSTYHALRIYLHSNVRLLSDELLRDIYMLRSKVLGQILAMGVSLDEVATVHGE